MTVTAAFSAVPITGLLSPDDQVQFTDESIGDPDSPDSWLWDFGDGEFSYEQHPLHTYVGEAGDKFTVKLTA